MIPWAVVNVDGILWVALWRYPHRYPPHIPHVAMTTICGFYREFYCKMPGTMIFIGFFVPWGGSKRSQAELDNRPQLCIRIYYIYTRCDDSAHQCWQEGFSWWVEGCSDGLLFSFFLGDVTCCSCFLAQGMRQLKVASFGQPSEIRDVQNDFVDTYANSLIKIARKKRNLF